MQVGQTRRPSRLVRGGTVSVLLAAFYICFLQVLPAQDSASKAAVPDSSQVQARSISAGARRHLAGAYGRLPLSFEANHGQAPAPVEFLARGAGYTLFLTEDGASLVLSAQQTSASDAQRSAVTMRLAGANPAVAGTGAEQLPGQANYFLGNDPTAWRTHIPTYGRVAYHDVYPGVDLVYYGHSGQLEYDFVVAPGADLSKIQLALDAQPHLTASGDLALPVGSGEVRFQKPMIYQSGPDGTRHYLDGEYAIASDSGPAARQESRVGFKVAAYDHSLPLVIDPTFTFATFLGGTGTDSALGIAVDTTGNIYVTGRTSSTNFPVKSPYQGTFSGGSTDAFITKISPDGLSIVYSTYLGGATPVTVSTSPADSFCGVPAGVTTAMNAGAAIAVDVTGAAYVTGSTNTSNFPITTGSKQTVIGGAFDAFVTKLSADGSSLSYSTYTGGTQNDCGTAITVDSAGDAYVAGSTSSKGFVATKNAYQTALAPGTSANAFFMELDTSGTAPAIYSTFLGGSGGDAAQGIALNPSCTTTTCDAYVTGQTTSLNFPVSSTTYQKSPGGGTDAFVAEINPAGSGTTSLVYSTYFGGSGNDIGYGIAVDPTGDAYITGSTTSSNLPVTAGVYQAGLKGSQDAFVAELDPTGSGLTYSTYLGGSGVDSAAAIAVDSLGNVFVTGNTQSTDFVPASVEALALQFTCATTSGATCNDAFVVTVTPGGASLSFATYLGGGLSDAGNAIALDPCALLGASSSTCGDDVYVAGSTLSTDFPATAGVFQPACAVSSTGACGNAFIAEISPQPPAVQMVPQIIPFGAQPLGVPSASQIVTVTNTSGSAVTFTSIATTGNYQIATSGTTCFTGSGSPLSAGGSCAITLTFTPNLTGGGGANQGTLVLTDNAAGSPQTALLKGTGVASVVSLSPASLTFGSQFVGTTSAPQAVTLVNSGSATLNITSIAVTANSGFAETNNCGTSVAAGASCTINVTFSPTASGTASGTLTVADNATGSPQTASLTGTGGSPTASLSATTLNFGSQVVGTLSSTPQKVVLTNTGNESLSITGISIGGTNPSEFTLSPANPCGSTVAQGSSCTIQVNFKPASSGSRSATLTITDNAPNNPQVVSLTGTGSDFQLGVSPGSQTVNPGQTTTYNLTVTPVGGFNSNVGLKCTGQPINTSCTLSLTTANMNGTSAVTTTVTVVTSAPSLVPKGWGRFRHPGAPLRLPWQIWLALGSLLALLSLARRRARAYVVIAATLILVTLWMGCGSGLTPPATVAAGTPAGTYTLTLSGTAGNLGHSVTTTLVVN